ncbi:MAG: alpha/beta fold hydrolase [Sneathiellaceae bacterium]
MSPAAAADPWIRCPIPRPAAGLRLFCLPYAGGGASLFNDWGRFLPESIEVCGIQLPGREERIAEPAFRQAGTLLPVLLDRLGASLDRPTAFFGHSMGALIAYEASLALAATGREPAHLIVSGQRPPHLMRPGRTSYRLSDAALCEKLRRLNGTPEAVLREPELLNLVLPPLRCDFELAETYRRSLTARLDCPVTVLGGQDDSEVDPRALPAWQEVTRGAVEVRLFPGDHFFLKTGIEPVLATIADALARHLRTPRGR